MIPLTMKLVQRPPSAAEIYKQTMFGTALGLTNTAKDGQKAVVEELKKTFTLRGTWYQQNMRHGIKVVPATKARLEAVIGTNADWLEPHETGRDKTARGGNVAVPTENVRRNKRMIIPRGQRPRGLGAKVFVLQTKNGPVLAQRISRGKNAGIRILYGLERSVRIRKQSTFYAPIDRVVRRNLNRNVAEGITRAFATMRR